MDIANIKTVGDLLAFLAGPGAVAVVVWFSSWALEELAWWQKLTSKARSLAILGGSIVLGVLATWLQSQPQIVAALEPYITPVISAIGVWLTSQIVHRANSKAVENKRLKWELNAKARGGTKAK